MEQVNWQDLIPIINHFGYFAVFFVIAAESMGIPMPGETILVTAAIYAGRTHHINIFFVVVAAIFGAIVGDNLGFAIGKSGGYPLLRKFGKYIKLDEPKLKVGQYLFLKHGGQIVFFGRFISILRTWAAFLAGVNRMHWKSFLAYNAAGAIVWASFYGTMGYLLGRSFNQFTLPIRITFFIVGTLFVIGSLFYTHYNLKALEKKAEKALPGHLK
jgi:membrane protein DedA with SNARE-associated domain